MPKKRKPADGRRSLNRLDMRRVTHKTCPTWGVTQCRRDLWPDKMDGAPKVSERWRDVTCGQCLKSKPHIGVISHIDTQPK
jgi:hypothetical protein